MRAEEKPSLSTWLRLMSLMDLRQLTSAALPCRRASAKLSRAAGAVAPRIGTA
jgi:hypothetical protein